MALATFPRFIGGKGLGATLSSSMMAKAGIVGQMLAIIFPGIVVYLVQGSPSGSSASGGTHVDEGDAGDFTYGYADGRAAGLAVYLIASILWRMLFCLSYVRGFDVNKDGIKDDSFSQHNHVIDREGDSKSRAWAVRNQIALFLARLDGLVGGRADREKVVPATMTLAEYQTPAGRATFLFRFQQLTSEALGLPVHTDPAPQEDDMIRFSCKNTVYCASIGAGTYWAVPGGFDEMLIGLPGVNTIGDINELQRDRIRSMCERAAASFPVAAPVVDAVALAKAIAPLLPAGSTVDVSALVQAINAIPQAVRAAIILEN